MKSNSDSFILAIVAIVLLMASVCHAQTGFNKGYVIDESGRRIEGYIAVQDLSLCPDSISFKFKENDAPEHLEISLLKEVAFDDHKYIKVHTRYDKSSQNYKTLTNSRQPDWVEADLMLRVIIEGQASLYMYRKRGLTLFFYKTVNTIEQLEYKSYFTITNADQVKRKIVAENLTYINQINTTMICTGVDELGASDMQYNVKSLTAHFVRFNKCAGKSYSQFDNGLDPIAFVKLTPGADFTRMKWTDVLGTTVNFPSQTNFRFGTEVELAFPRKTHAWGVIIEPTFQYYHSNRPYRVTYRSIETPIGIRHYFFRGTRTRVFINVAVVLDLPLRYDLELTSQVTTNANNAVFNFAGGAGATFGRFSLEARYYTNRATEDQYFSLKSDYRKSSIIVGYRLY